MEDEAYYIIKPLVITECVVAAFVGNDPNSGEDAALDSPIKWPGQESKMARKGVEVMGGNVIENKGYGEVINDI